MNSTSLKFFFVSLILAFFTHTGGESTAGRVIIELDAGRLPCNAGNSLDPCNSFGAVIVEEFALAEGYEVDGEAFKPSEFTTLTSKSESDKLFLGFHLGRL